MINIDKDKCYITPFIPHENQKSIIYVHRCKNGAVERYKEGATSNPKIGIWIHQCWCEVAIERSWSCWGSTSDGDLVRAHCAVVVFGNAITSLMELAPANNITILSNP